MAKSPRPFAVSITCVALLGTCVAWLGTSVAGLGCSTPRSVERLAPDFCYDCHGDRANGNNAPPPAFWLDAGVPADPHQSHLRPSDEHAEIVCTDCHAVPETVRDPGHVDSERPAELTWGALSTSDGASPAFDGTGCAGVYCHGATLIAGGTVVAPAWSVGDGMQADCGTCHGLPPDAPHPSNEDCSRCHPTANADRDILQPLLHVNGLVEFNGTDCDDCHGSDGVSAPPDDLAGNVDTTSRGVGAHRAHLGTSTTHAEITCDQCHLNPKNVDDPGHVDTGPPAELTWGSVATADGASPFFDGTSCANVYCHGATLEPGGTNDEPDWTSVGTGQADCGTCHGLPPGGSHPPFDFCSRCHPTADDQPEIVAPDLHVNGVVDLLMVDCDDCHGSAASPAPPPSLDGSTSTTVTAVGAHASHLASSDWHAEVTCDQCHLVPVDVADPGHYDTPLPAELTWGALPATDGAAPVWDGTTCAGVYCHGATLLPGGANTTPAWTLVGSGEAACGTCHGLPPDPPHTANPACYTCHPTVDSALGFLLPDEHIDGVVEVNSMHAAGWALPTAHGAAFNASGPSPCQACHAADLSGGTTAASCNACHPGWQSDCTFCHGGGFVGAAPPEDVAGNVATSFRGVGAHASHLASSTWHAPIACAECHLVPAAALDAGHVDGDGLAEITWGARAVAGGATPTWDGTTCAGAYCHGVTISGGTNTAPTWTSVGTGEAACGACHAFTATASHPCGPPCSTCHAAVVDAALNIIAPALHIDGIVESTGTCP